MKKNKNTDEMFKVRLYCSFVILDLQKLGVSGLTTLFEVTGQVLDRLRKCYSIHKAVSHSN